TPDVAEDLRDYLRDRASDSPVWPGGGRRRPRTCSGWTSRQRAALTSRRGLTARARRLPCPASLVHRASGPQRGDTQGGDAVGPSHGPEVDDGRLRRAGLDELSQAVRRLPALRHAPVSEAATPLATGMDGDLISEKEVSLLKSCGRGDGGR